jgi:hypothetical protein
MFSKYFEQLEKRILKNVKIVKKGAEKETDSGKREGIAPLKHGDLINNLGHIVPAHLKLGTLKIIDSSGYSPEGVDFVAYKEVFRDLDKMMDGYIPAEVVYGTFHVCQSLNSRALGNTLKHVIHTKKINRYIEELKEESIIPAFIIAYHTSMSLPELKDFVTNFYISKSVEFAYEFDIIVIFNFGIVVKDWKEKRSFLALETGKDTLKWFFMLMNEYMDVERGMDLDFRSYVKRQEKYKEY